MSEIIKINAVRSNFIEENGLIAQAEGLPRIAGRVFGLLIFDGMAVSFSDLATDLQVSRASISTSVRLLEERGLIRRMTKPGHRGDFFQLAQNPYANMLEVILKRSRISGATMADTIESLPQNSEQRTRIQAHADFYDSITSGLQTALDDLNQKSADIGQNRPAAKEA